MNTVVNVAFEKQSHRSYMPHLVDIRTAAQSNLYNDRRLSFLIPLSTSMQRLNDVFSYTEHLAS